MELGRMRSKTSGFTVPTEKIMGIKRAGREEENPETGKKTILKNQSSKRVVEDAETRERYLCIAGKGPVRSLVIMDKSCDFQVFGSEIDYPYLRARFNREMLKRSGVK